MRVPLGLSGAGSQVIIRDTLLGVAHCHAHGVVHRDVKADNILIAEGGIVKLADFGQARLRTALFQEAPSVCPLTPEMMTLDYRAPEILLGAKTYGSGVDVWSVGVLLVDLLEKRYGSHASEIAALISIFQRTGVPTEATWPGVTALPNFTATVFQACPPRGTLERGAALAPSLDELGQDLLGRMMTPDPTQRISAAEAAAHAWFEGAPPTLPARICTVLRRPTS